MNQHNLPALDARTNGMRFWISCLLLSLLGGCFTSETPNIPVEALSRPHGFNGQFWFISLKRKSDVSAYLVGVKAKSDGTFMQSRGDTAQFRLVSLIDENVYLFVADTEHLEGQDDNLSTYYLLEKKPGGVWGLEDISINGAGPFSAQNEAYLQSVASRYGLTLGSPEERTRIMGPVHGLAIPQLFRDPEFLGALAVTPFGAYLPARPGSETEGAASLEDLWRDTHFELELAGKPELPKSSMASPEGFEGSYLADLGEFSSIQDARIDARPDGRFDMHIGEDLYTVALLPFDHEHQVYVGVRDWDFLSSGASEHHTSLVIISRTVDGWTMGSIVPRPLAGSEMINSLFEGLMTKALRRHGLEITDGKIGGDLNGERLLELLHDAQFTSGLAVDSQSVTFVKAERQ